MLDRHNLSIAAGILAVLAFLALVAAMPQGAAPAGATVTTGSTGAWEFYSNDDLKGTTVVTLTYAASRWMIQNAGTTGTLNLVPTGSTTASTAAHIAIPPGATYSDECKTNDGLVSGFQFWSSATCSVNLVTGREF